MANSWFLKKKLIVIEYTEYRRHCNVYYLDPYFTVEENDVLNADPCLYYSKPWMLTTL